MRGTVTSWVALSIAASLVPAVAVAEEARDDAREEARELSQQARINYNLGRFEQALEGYARVYEVFHHPAFLFNIGQCHRELGRCDRALFFFEGYLREDSAASNRGLVMELIAECRQALERQRSDAAARAGRAEAPHETRAPPPARAEPAAPEEHRVEREVAATAVSPAHDRDEGRRPPVYRRWWFWTILGVAVAGAVTAGTIAGVANREPGTVLPSGSAGMVDWR
jgi:tetratricopeptide (TPR) repeat protein